MSWKHRHRSFYTEAWAEPEDPELDPRRTALLVVDVQNVYLDLPDPATFDADELARHRAWAPFFARMRDVVVPNVVRLLARFRAADLEVACVRIGSRREDGRDRPRARRSGGSVPLLADEPAARIADAVAPLPGEFVASRTGDSALSGTGLCLALRTLGITDVVVTGVLTDQCISSTVRALADEDFSVILVEDACAAGTDAIHVAELATLNRVFCLVMQTDELLPLLPS
jgi:nicotinamidase-related amidase